MRGKEPGLRRLDHCLGFVRELHRRCVVNGEGVWHVAEQCEQSTAAFNNIVFMLRTIGRLPSDERLACIAMQDPGLDDEDIGDIFGRTTRWARAVRAARDDIEVADFIPAQLTWFAGHITRCDPTPEEIRERCAAALALRPSLPLRPAHRRGGEVGGIRTYLPRSSRGSLVFRTVG